MAGSIKTNTPPRWLLAELTYACPLQCPYCSNPIDYARYQAELSTEDWLRVLTQARKMCAGCIKHSSRSEGRSGISSGGSA